MARHYESKRKDFTAIIDSAQFLDLVQQVHMVTPTRSEQSDTDSSCTPTPAAQKRKNLTEQNHRPGHNKKPKHIKKKQQTNIEHAASSLELLELDLLTSIEETPSNRVNTLTGVGFVEGPSSNASNEVSSVEETDAPKSTPQPVTSCVTPQHTVTTNSAQQETVPQLQPVTSSNCQQVLPLTPKHSWWTVQRQCSVPQNSATSFVGVFDGTDSAQSSTRSSSVLGEAFDVLNNTYSTGTQPDVQQRLESMELEISKCWSYIHQLQNQVSWLYNQQQINASLNQQATANQPCTAVNTESTPDAESEPVQMVPLENRPIVTAMATGQLSYTKEQLKSICQNQPDYSKAAKKLFLRLFKKEEYVGRSVTGKAPNKATLAKPRIENREKLQLLYDVVAEVYNVRKESHINRELADLLKPSRCR